jgi:hypothetical protein
MPPHLQILDTLGDPADPIVVSLAGGEESAVFTLDIWNDKDDEFLDTTTAIGIRLRLLASTDGGVSYFSSGEPILDERWTRIRVTASEATGVDEIDDQVTGTLPFGTSAEIPLDDIPPQARRRIELQVITPGAQTLNETRIALAIVGNLASSPLAQFTALAMGSAVAPADRITGLRSILDGHLVTADDTDTVVVAGGHFVYDGTESNVLDEDVTFNLQDSAAANLGAGEDYLVTLSRQSGGVLTVTKSTKAATEYPDVPAGEIFVANLTVASADGVAVTVAQASVIQAAMRYAAFHARAGAGLTVLVSRGDGIASTDLRQYISHEISVAVEANQTNRVWVLPDGQLDATLTDAEPVFGAYLVCLATTDGANVTEIVDARRFAHRALTEWPIDLAWSGYMSEVDQVSYDGVLDAAAWTVVHFDCEAEEIMHDLSDVDATWTGGEIKIDLRVLAPGAPIGDGTGGVSLFTSSGTDDRRPVIAFDATVLQSRTRDHEVRRIVKGSRLLLTVISTITTSGGEAIVDLRAKVIARRYR